MRGRRRGTVALMAPTAASDDSGRSAKWQERREAIVDTSAQVFARRGYHATGIARAVRGQRLREGRVLLLHRFEGGAPRRDPRSGDGRGDARCGPRRGRRAGRRRRSWRCSATSCSTSSTAIRTTCGCSSTSSPRSPRNAPISSGNAGGSTSAGSRRSCGPGIDTGEFRDVDPWLTARAWLGMHNYTYLWLKPGGSVSARDVAKPFADIFTRGIDRPTA